MPAMCLYKCLLMRLLAFFTVVASSSNLSTQPLKGINPLQR